MRNEVLCYAIEIFWRMVKNRWGEEKPPKAVVFYWDDRDEDLDFCFWDEIGGRIPQNPIGVYTPKEWDTIEFSLFFTYLLEYWLTERQQEIIEKDFEERLLNKNKKGG